MTYNELPLIPILVTRGNSQRVVLQDFSVDGEFLDLTGSCPKIQFKQDVDALRYVEFELNEENGGLEIEPSKLTMIFSRETSKLGMNKYYGDLLLKIDDLDVTVLRFELLLEGVTTTKTKNEC